MDTDKHNLRLVWLMIGLAGQLDAGGVAVHRVLGGRAVLPDGGGGEQDGEAEQRPLHGIHARRWSCNGRERVDWLSRRR